MLGKSIRNIVAAVGALALMSGAALAQKVTIAVGGAGCLCYLPTVLAHQLGELRRPASRSSWSTSRADRNRSRR
jgi:NitT/TauT family transport system substrate-binding protein